MRRKVHDLRGRIQYKWQTIHLVALAATAAAVIVAQLFSVFSAFCWSVVAIVANSTIGDGRPVRDRTDTGYFNFLLLLFIRFISAASALTKSSASHWIGPFLEPRRECGARTNNRASLVLRE